jgi:hypothetical protein
MQPNQHNVLLRKLRASRESWIDLGAVDLLLRRPTRYALASFSARRAPDEDYLRAAIVDWKRVQEIHLLPGGTAVDVPFDIDTCIEWLEDRTDLWSKAREALREVIQRALSSSATSTGAPAVDPLEEPPTAAVAAPTASAAHEESAETAPPTAAKPQGEADAHPIN